MEDVQRPLPERHPASERYERRRDVKDARLPTEGSGAGGHERDGEVVRDDEAARHQRKPVDDGDVEADIRHLGQDKSRWSLMMAARWFITARPMVDGVSKLLLNIRSAKSRVKSTRQPSSLSRRWYVNSLMPGGTTRSIPGKPSGNTL